MHILKNAWRFIEQSKNWFYGFWFCQNHGGYLAEITSKDETELANMFLPTEQYHWIALNDLVSPGNWQWQNSHVNANYTNWKWPAEPNLFSACVMIGLGVKEPRDN